jgi:hypothetical protein
MESFSGRAWRKQRQSAGAAEKKRSIGFGVAVGVLRDEGFENLQNVLLLSAGQVAGPLEHAPEFACRPAAAVWWRSWVDEFFHPPAENLRQVRNLFGLERDGVTLPKRIGRLSDAQLFGDLLLRQSRRFAGGAHPFAESGAFNFGRPACFHVGSIKPEKVFYR